VLRLSVNVRLADADFVVLHDTDALPVPLPDQVREGVLLSVTVEDTVEDDDNEHDEDPEGLAESVLVTVKLGEDVLVVLLEVDPEWVLVLENVPLAVVLLDPDQLEEALPVAVREALSLWLREQVGEEVAETVSLRDLVQL